MTKKGLVESEGKKFGRMKQMEKGRREEREKGEERRRGKRGRKGRKGEEVVWIDFPFLLSSFPPPPFFPFSLFSLSSFFRNLEA
ncbi:hypothetical protein [Fibrisoma limi]|uniref:hypothetical protein n=1 Tax=Fibrisoma limi TaxID=663275 RepID=UPI000587DE57|nr:hypothetical protein [Fibrisoma limi]